MTAIHPGADPYEHGLLDVGDGQRLYWETCGDPGGRPAVVLHGGPGSGCSPAFRRLFDPAWRLVLFDQRQCGRSTPHASAFGTDLSVNTTAHLVADLERLRERLGIERWLVYGASWGSTLALAYAQRFPQRVHAIVLSAVTTTRRSELAWLYGGGLAPLFPAEWERFRAGVPSEARDGDLIDAYARLLAHPDPAVRARAAEDWVAWDTASMTTRRRPQARFADPAYRMAFARIVTHYFRHAAWLEEGVLLREAGRLAGIPGVLVHGRLDLQAPLATAWELERRWPGVELVVVEGAGHALGEPGMALEIVRATDRFAQGGRP